jgi:hypothetical protein
LPGWKIKQTFSFFKVRKAVAKVASNVAPRMEIASFKVELMNRDEAERQKYLDDPLVYHGNISSATAATMLKAISAQDLSAVTCPTFVIAAECEGLVDRDAASSAFESVSSATKLLKTLRGAWHDVVHDPEKETVFADIGDWVDAVLAVNINDNSASVRVSEYRVDDGWLSAIVPDSVFVRVRMLAPMRQSNAGASSNSTARPSTPPPEPDVSSNPFDCRRRQHRRPTDRWRRCPQPAMVNFQTIGWLNRQMRNSPERHHLQQHPPPPPVAVVPTGRNRHNRRQAHSMEC